MTTRRLDRRTLLFGLAAVTLTGCGDEASADEPPEISYGRDLCARCRMIISEERFAAGLVANDGKSVTFDDPGELVATVQDEGIDDRRVWVHDYDTRAWADGTAAYYLAIPGLMTPMGTGVIAFADRSAAEAFAVANQGTVMTWQEILQSWSIQARVS